MNTPTGRRRVSFYGATVEEAADKRTAAVADRNRGALFTDPRRLTVSEYLERWLADSALYQEAASTYGRYLRTCKNHLIPFFGRIKLRELSPPHVRAFKARKIESGLDPNTIGVMQGVLSAALNQAVDDGLILQNPASRVRKAAKRGKTPMRALTEEEASKLLDVARGMRDEALLTLALAHGDAPGGTCRAQVGGPRPRRASQRVDCSPIGGHENEDCHHADEDGRGSYHRLRTSHRRGSQESPLSPARGEDGQEDLG